MNWWRILKITGAALAALMIAVACIFIYALFSVHPVDTEIARYPNSKGSLEAVVVQRNNGATVSMRTVVFIVSKGAEPRGDGDFVGEYVEGLNIHWLNDERVVIHVDNARILYMTPEYSYADGALKDPIRITYEIIKTGRPD